MQCFRRYSDFPEPDQVHDGRLPHGKRRFFNKCEVMSLVPIERGRILSHDAEPHSVRTKGIRKFFRRSHQLPSKSHSLTAWKNVQRRDVEPIFFLVEFCLHITDNTAIDFGNKSIRQWTVEELREGVEGVVRIKIVAKILIKNLRHY
jgi:hypothetical protein